MGRGGRNHSLLGGELRPPRSSPKLRKGNLPRQRGECVRACGSSLRRQQKEREHSRGCVGASPQPPPCCWYVPTGSAPSRFPALGPAWLPARARRPHRGPELPWPSGRRRRGSGSAGVRRPSPAAATRRTASLRSRQKMTPGPRSWDLADPYPLSLPRNAPRTWSQTRGRWCELRTRRRRNQEASSPWTIPMILDGKDVVAMARTGSGKTACFLIPMFERLKTHSAQTGARALILSPTRELALQTMKFTKELGKFTGLRTALILGGDKMEDQFAALHENPDIIIATPGRLVHVAVEMNLKLQSVEYVVFDEADRLFEMGFAEQLQEIIGRLPGSHQTVLFSATLPKLLVEFARAGLTEPVLIRLDVDSKLNEQLKTSFFLVREDSKAAVLLHLLRSVVRPQDQTVVFVATKHHAEYLSELLATQGVSCAHIYSALDQTARKINLARFTHGKCSALIVTDLAARGLDIPLLDNVINYSFPAKGKLFLHRVGRVARAGRSGTAYSLVAPDEVPYLLDLHLFLGRALTLARPPEEPTGTEGRDGVLGRVPQGVVDDEDCGLRTSLEASLELRGLSRVADNAQQQYVRSRPAPSPESIKRAKELDLAGLGLHPLFSSCFQQEELQRLRLVDSIRNYRSRADVFTEVVGRKRQQPGPHQGAKRRREEARQRDQAFFIPYRPKDFDSERGLSVGGDGGAFEQQVAGAVLDLMGDEAQSLTRGRQQLKWDRKKKRFVGQSGQEDKKKIKTESGRYISSSYKRDLYQKWKQKHKIDDRDSEEEGTFDRRGSKRRGGKRGRGQGISQPRTPGTPTGRVRSELKTKQQILKQRRRAQKMRFLQRGGLKQLSARNRHRAQELQQGAFGRGTPSKKGKMRKRM
uniref:ATP-dependent RNA helicase DDX54 n=1 Tax=Moschus moschiferus TaxID=68415 RepID=A0A8C6E7H1_MOSMO